MQFEKGFRQNPTLTILKSSHSDLQFFKINERSLSSSVHIFRDLASVFFLVTKSHVYLSLVEHPYLLYYSSM